MSLRGASSGEISRDALLAKVSQERELRSYARRANAAALYIQVLRSFDSGLTSVSSWSLSKHPAGVVNR